MRGVARQHIEHDEHHGGRGGEREQQGDKATQKEQAHGKGWVGAKTSTPVSLTAKPVRAVVRWPAQDNQGFAGSAMPGITHGVRNGLEDHRRMHQL